MRGEDNSGDGPKKTYGYFYCRNCKKYFTMESFIPGSACPFCSTPGRHGLDVRLVIVAKEYPIQDRLHIAIAKCTHCADAPRCPDCFGAEKEFGGKKRNPNDCRYCFCAKCCSETIEFAQGVRSGRISLWQAVMDLAREKGAEPGPMAKLMEQEFEDEIPF
jgi:hypothetical protein